jgi:hypothetical protein
MVTQLYHHALHVPGAEVDVLLDVIAGTLLEQLEVEERSRGLVIHGRPRLLTYCGPPAA